MHLPLPADAGGGDLAEQVFQSPRFPLPMVMALRQSCAMAKLGADRHSPER
jgi:hypothetical protein